MRLVVDMNLSPDWVAILKQAGHAAVHWSSVGSPNAKDRGILTWAGSLSMSCSPTVSALARSWRQRRPTHPVHCRFATRIGHRSTVARSSSPAWPGTCPTPGFTQIELLVVIAIIAVLASLLLPALARSRDRVVLLQCVQRQRQLHVMYMMYASDNDGIFPWTHGNRFPRAVYGLPTGFHLEAYGPFEFSEPYDFLGQLRGCAWDCLGEKYWGIGFQIIAGWGGTCAFMVNGVTNQSPLSYPCTAADAPRLQGRRNTIRVDRDIGDDGKCQTFFTCFAESYSGFTAHPQYGSHFWRFGLPECRGASIWSDGHATLWSSADSRFRIMFNQGSSSMWWNEE